MLASMAQAQGCTETSMAEEIGSTVALLSAPLSPTA
jgi:hypothetical protein